MKSLRWPTMWANVKVAQKRRRAGSFTTTMTLSATANKKTMANEDMVFAAVS